MEFLKAGVYIPLTKGDLRVALSRNRLLGWGKLRLLPKHSCAQLVLHCPNEQSHRCLCISNGKKMPFIMRSLSYMHVCTHVHMLVTLAH